MDLHKVIVSVDVDDPRVIAEIAAELTDMGLEIDNILESLAVITGTCDSSAISSLEHVPGVLDVEPQRTVRVAPPADGS